MACQDRSCPWESPSSCRGWHLSLGSPDLVASGGSAGRFWRRVPTFTVDDVLGRLGRAQGSVLDLSDFGHDRHSHPDPTPLVVLAWALLQVDAPPRRILLPQSSAARRVLGRAGLVFVAERRSVELAIDDDVVSPAACLRQPGPADPTLELPGFDWKRYDQLLTAADGSEVEPLTRLRVITDLQDPARRPPPPDDYGRRYRWIDNTRAGSGLPKAERKRFYGDAGQSLFEAIENVHDWGEAGAALACCAVTKGGGEQSFNRFHIVVVDDGMGIHESIRRRRVAEELRPWQEEERVQDLAASQGIDPSAALLRLLVLEALGARSVEPADRGQGLHAIATLSGQWSGSFSVATADGARCWWVARTGGEAPLRSGSWSTPGLHGVMLHTTLDGKPARPSVARSGQESSPEPAPVLA